jgi:hypothetical protein
MSSVIWVDEKRGAILANFSIGWGHMPDRYVINRCSGARYIIARGNVLEGREGE